MREYAKASPKFWTGDTGRQIRTFGAATQVVAFYLFTGPNANMIGLYYLPLPTLCHETGRTLEEASKALRSLSEVGFAHYDEQSELVFLPNMAREQIGELLTQKDNRHKAVVRELEQFRKSHFHADFLRIYREAYELDEITPSAPKLSPSKAPSKALRSQEQEQEQEQEQNKTPTAAKPPRAKKVRDPDPEWLADFKREFPDRLGDQEWRRAVRAGIARIAEGHTPAEFIAGAKRYHAHCKALEKIGTQYVKQAASFLGPDKHFLSPWPVSKTINGVPARHQLP